MIGPGAAQSTTPRAGVSPAWRVAKIGVVAAAYAALVYAVPISYMPGQARIAETLKPLVIWEPDLIPAFVIGNLLSNIGSPYGPWDWTWMPFANLVGAWTAWRLGRVNAYLGATCYAIVISLALATMFHFVYHAPFYVFLFRYPLVLVEVLLIAGGVPVMWPVHRALSRAFKSG